MEIPLSQIWTVAAFLIGLEVAAFTWRVSREIAVAESGGINWLPPADIMNLVGMIVAFGVFILPLVGIQNQRVLQLLLGVSIILFIGYPFALAGHYELYTRGQHRSGVYAPRQEKVAVAVTIIAATAFLVLSV